MYILNDIKPRTQAKTQRQVDQNKKIIKTQRIPRQPSDFKEQFSTEKHKRLTRQNHFSITSGKVERKTTSHEGETRMIKRYHIRLMLHRYLTTGEKTFQVHQDK